MLSKTERISGSVLCTDPFIAVPGDHHCEPLHLSIRSEAVNHSSRSRFPYSL